METFIKFAKISIDESKIEKHDESYFELQNLKNLYFEYKDVFEDFCFNLGEYKFGQWADVSNCTVCSLGIPFIIKWFTDDTDLCFLSFHLVEIIRRNLPNRDYGYIPGMSLLLMKLLDEGYKKEAMLLLSVAGGPAAIDKYLEEDWSPLSAICTFNMAPPPKISLTVKRDEDKMKELARMTEEKEEELLEVFDDKKNKDHIKYLIQKEKEKSLMKQ